MSHKKGGTLVAQTSEITAIFIVPRFNIRLISQNKTSVHSGRIENVTCVYMNLKIVYAVTPYYTPPMIMIE